MPTILVNGESKEIPTRYAVADLLADLKLEPAHVAVELNLEVLPRSAYLETTLQAEDRLEIVTFVGGG